MQVDTRLLTDKQVKTLECVGLLDKGESAMSAYRIEVFCDVAKFWRWRLRAANGRILASSEAYCSERSCLDTVEKLAKATGFPVVNVKAIQMMVKLRRWQNDNDA